MTNYTVTQAVHLFKRPYRTACGIGPIYNKPDLSVTTVRIRVTCKRCRKSARI